jgi:excisionase family DNA binding protein
VKARIGTTQEKEAMQHRRIQRGVRKNPASQGAHGLLLSPNSTLVPVVARETSRTDDGNESSSSLQLGARTFNLSLTEIEAVKRSQPRTGPLSSSLSRAEVSDARSSLVTRALARGGANLYENAKFGQVKSAPGAVAKNQTTEQREATTIEGAEAERHRRRGKWSVSPLWEAKILLGVLKQQGLAGKGLVEAFEKWAPRIAGSSRADIGRLYLDQTGRELSDYILVQQADKVVRYNQLPPDAEVVRRALLNSEITQVPEANSDFSARFKARLDLETDSAAGMETSGGVSGIMESEAGGPLRKQENGPKKRDILTTSKQRLLDTHDPNVLLSTNELAILIGFKPKTIRRWVSQKFLNYIRVGNRFRFRLAAVELFLAQREVRD